MFLVHLLFATCAIIYVCANTCSASDLVTLQRTPNGGIQPQAVVDAQQTIHLIYFKGEAKAGDLYYVSRKTGETEFSKPIKVNSRPASAVAIGTVRGGQLALGKKGRVHVAWNGASGIGGMQYSRLSDTGDAFEPQRNLMQKSFLPDGGCSIAANESGQVLVAWHGVTTGQEGEDQRQMWAARSSDDGNIHHRGSSLDKYHRRLRLLFNSSTLG